jgi:hypothetical protein
LKGNIGDDSIAGPTGRAQAKIAAHQNLFTAMVNAEVLPLIVFSLG